MLMRLIKLRRDLLLVLSGALCVFSFAPIEWPGFILAGMALLFWSTHNSSTAAQAARHGFAFGLGYFAAHVHWIYISMHDFGGMPGWMAFGCVLAFSAYLALFPALTAWLSHRLPCRENLRLPLLLPTLFILTEWLRGWLFTGFPWATIGSSQIKLLAGWYPLIGVYGAGWLLALTAALFIRQWRKGFAMLGIILLAGWSMAKIEWTHTANAPVTVSLVQGGIPQSERWDMRLLDQTMARYYSLVGQTKGEIVLLPEAAIPVLLSDIPPEYLAALRRLVTRRNASLVSGFITGDENRYLNSVVTLTGSPQIYSKHHLVPFGEFIPMPALFGWMYAFMEMPMSSFGRGALAQPPIRLGSTLLGINICYEDIFGDELRLGARQATLLVNVSNMAWFDGSWAADQHLQMSRARALETGRWMIRATNTGATAIIDHHGNIVDQLPAGERGILEGRAENRNGLTPYSRWGDALPLSLLGGLVFFLLALAYRDHKASSRQSVM